MDRMLRYGMVCLGILLTATGCTVDATGESVESEAIWGGRAVNDAAYPFFHEITYPRRRTDGVRVECGATAIAPTWALTAAHCVAERARPSELRVGNRCLEAIVHPAYDPVRLYNDIALLRIVGCGDAKFRENYREWREEASREDDERDSFDYRDYIDRDYRDDPGYRGYDDSKSIESKLEDAFEEFRGYPLLTPFTHTIRLGIGLDAPGATGTVIGKGLVDPWRHYRQLREALAPIHDGSVCASTLDYTTVTPQMICAGYPPGNPNYQGFCTGDSGGPLLRHDGTQWRQIGIVSWGADGCGSYNVYTRASSYIGWIESVVGASVR